MISLLLAVLAAGAANVALVVFLADRLGPQSGTGAAGELAATTGGLQATATRGAVKIGNENATTLAARRAA